MYESVSFRPIEEVFIRTGRVLHLHLSDGQTIRTTPEHPFWVEELGWTPADVLRAGMRLATLGGEWVSVEEAYDTGEYETVYNCRVAEYHTYFVGDDTHVLAVWAHNTYTQRYYVAQDTATAFDTTDEARYTVYDSTNGTKLQAVANSANGVVHIGDFVPKAKPEDAAAYLMKYQTAFGIQSVEELYNVFRGPAATAGANPYMVIAINGRDSRTNNLWAKQIENKKDALGKFKTDADTIFKDFKKDPAEYPHLATTEWYEHPHWSPNSQPPLMTIAQIASLSSADKANAVGIHAHHIVPKNAASPTKKEVKEAWWNSQRALRTVGIDPFFGVANLAWTPNWPKHSSSGAYRISVWEYINDKLPGFSFSDNPTTKSVESRQDDKVAMITALGKIAENFFYARMII